MNPTIKHINGTVLYDGEAGMTTRQMLEKATASKTNLYGADLRDADLRDADLRGADLVGANLYGAYLRDADLSDAYLGGADLRDADLSGAYLGGAYLVGADLRDADLRGADLYGAYLRGAYLHGADLVGAYMGEKFGKLIGARPFFQCGPVGSRSDYLQSFITDKGIIIKAGCFTGFIDEFVAAVEKTHGDSGHGKEYAMVVLMIEAHAAIWQQQ